MKITPIKHVEFTNYLITPEDEEEAAALVSAIEYSEKKKALDEYAAELERELSNGNI